MANSKIDEEQNQGQPSKKVETSNHDQELNEHKLDYCSRWYMAGPTSYRL